MFAFYLPRHKGASLSFILFCLLIFLTIQPASAQNNYPSSGDALIHGLTIGTGPGTYYFQNTALGYNALSSSTGGAQCVAVGYNALSKNTGGGYNNGFANTAVGYYSLLNNTLGQYNTAIGANTLANNTTGAVNTAIGLSALEGNSTGSGNVGVGVTALGANSTGSFNTGLGSQALYASNTGNNNVAVGVSALYYSNGLSYLVAVGDSTLVNNTGQWNTAVGSKTLLSNTSGFENTALGFQGLYTNTTGYANTAVGNKALYSNQGGGNNAAVGAFALYYNTSGIDNSASGSFALYLNTTGSYNSSSGILSMYNNNSGSDNSALGLEAMVNNTTGSDNTAVGAYSGPSTSNLTNATAIGYNAAANASNSVVIGNSSVTSIGGYAGWSNFSDGRFKKNVNRNVPGLVFIKKLVPITYTLDIDGIETTRQKGTTAAKGPNNTTLPRPLDDPAMKQAMKEKSAVVYTGFIAQDVDKAARSIGYDFSGVDKPKDDQQSFYGLRYSDFVVPLVKAVQELSAENDSLQQANAQLSQRVDQIEQLLGLKTAAGPTESTLALSSARLFQNIPNPFNQTTLINYYLPQTTGTALIRITGINGETIRSIALNGTGAGQLSVQTAQLAAGTYMYTLIVDGNLIDTKRMVLVK
ncbi:MAG TPA: T9SS type A sorting domain-containing protein [Puia sp.]|nr:T9SS type A sorting domain-containing protein [Puia sp.]